MHSALSSMIPSPLILEFYSDNGEKPCAGGGSSDGPSNIPIQLVFKATRKRLKSSRLRIASAKEKLDKLQDLLTQAVPAAARTAANAAPQDYRAPAVTLAPAVVGHFFA